MSVLRRFGVFEQALVDALQWGHAYSLDLLYRAVPALYEWIFDDSPPGGGAQVCYGHDHSGNTADPAGKGLPRNGVVSGAWGAGDQYQWEVATPAGGGGGAPGIWCIVDVDEGNSRSDDVVAGGLGYMIQGYIDCDLDTDNYATLFGEAYIAVYIHYPNGGADCDIKVVNRTPGAIATDSAISHLVQPAINWIQWIRVTDIPIVGGEWNQFNIEARNGGGIEDVVSVRIYGYVLSEVYRAGSFADAAHAAPLTQTPQVGDPG